MRVLVTGSAGRIGREICAALRARGADVVPVDRASQGASLDLLDLTLSDLVGVDGIIHTAALHAPHVGLVPDSEFERVNVDGTRDLVALAKRAGVRRLIFTSTTALYGAAAQVEDRALWVTETTPVMPQTIYHRSKLAAEAALREAAGEALSLCALRVSRCFPEPLPTMAMYRLHRGIDPRDAALAHLAALQRKAPGYEVFIVSAYSPFQRADAADLLGRAAQVVAHRAPLVHKAFELNGWTLPTRIDRVYDASLAIGELDWLPRYGALDLIMESAS